MQRLCALLFVPLVVAVHAAGDVATCRGQAVPQSAETLLAAQQAALAVDDRLAAFGHRAEASRSDLAVAEAERLPRVSLRGGYEMRTDDRAFALAAPGLPFADARFPYRQRESASLQAGVSVQLYTSGRIRSRVAAADAEATSLSLSYEAVRLDVLRDAGRAFVEIHRQQRLRCVREVSVRTLTRHLHDVQMAYDQGMATRNELLTASVRLSAAKQELLRAQHAEDFAWSDYNRILKRPLDHRTTLAEPEVPLPAAPYEELLSRAHRYRPEAGELGVRAQALHHEARAHRQTRLPQVYGQGGFLFEENRYQSPEEIGYVGVVVDWELWDGGSSGHRSAAARERATAAQRRQSELVGLIDVEVRRGWLDLHEALSRLEATRTDIAQAEENLRVVQQLFREGMARSSDVLAAEEISSESGLRHFNARYDAVLAEIQLKRAVGGSVQ